MEDHRHETSLCDCCFCRLCLAGGLFCRLAAPRKAVHADRHPIGGPISSVNGSVFASVRWLTAGGTQNALAAPPERQSKFQMEKVEKPGRWTGPADVGSFYWQRGLRLTERKKVSSPLSLQVFASITCFGSSCRTGCDLLLTATRFPGLNFEAAGSCQCREMICGGARRAGFGWEGGSTKSIWAGGVAAATTAAGEACRVPSFVPRYSALSGSRSALAAVSASG